MENHIKKNTTMEDHIKHILPNKDTAIDDEITQIDAEITEILDTLYDVKKNIERLRRYLGDAEYDISDLKRRT